MGFIDRYKRFAELSDEEVRDGFRKQADEQLRKDLERVEVIDLAVTTPEEMPHPSVAAAISFAGKRALNRAGDPLSGELRDLLAAASGAERGHLAVGPGASGLIGALAAAVLSKGDVLVTPWPSYPLYPLAAASAAADAVPLGPSRDPSELAAAAASQPGAKLLIVCNPNDPDGSLMTAPQIKQLREELPGEILLVIDEALADYAGSAYMTATSRLAQDSEGIILVRTMSKAWGLAGLRVGWMIGGDDSRELFSRMSPLLGVSWPSEAGAIAALKDAPTTPERRAAEVSAQISRLNQALRGSQVELGETATNFIWSRIPGINSTRLHDLVLASGVRVLDGAEVGDPEHVRATVRADSAATERLAEALLAAADAAN